jgi:hypothetical protein
MHYRLNCLSFAVLLGAAQLSFAGPGATPLTCAAAPGIKTESKIQFVPSQGIYTVDVTFIGKRPSDKEIDRILRDCVAVAAKRDGTKDILGSPWFRKRVGDNPNNDDLLHPYEGLRYLSYEAASKNIGVRELKLKKKSQ